MKPSDILGMSLRNLWRRKWRTILTILGVFIGTTSIVVMISIGVGQRELIRSNLADIGSLTQISVRPNSEHRGGGMPGARPDKGSSKEDEGKTINDSTLPELANIPNVKQVIPVFETQIMMKQGSYETQTTMTAYPLEYLQSLKMTFEKGDWPEEGKGASGLGFPFLVGSEVPFNFYNPKGGNDDDMIDYENYEEYLKNRKAKVNLIDTNVFVIFQVDEYYQSQYPDPNAKVVTAKPKKYPLKADAMIKRSATMDQYSYRVLTDIEPFMAFLKRIYKGKALPGQKADKKGRPRGPVNYSYAIVETDDLESTEKVQDDIRALGYNTSSALEYVKPMEQFGAISQAILGGIGGISLLVAAIGIANTMMMSIYERTKEIGVYKVLGCSLSNIRSLFLAEATMIGFIGGVFGLGASYGISALINQLIAKFGQSGNLPFGGAEGEAIKLSVIHPDLAITAILFSTFIGMLSGLMPANRAMKLSALAALRNE